MTKCKLIVLTCVAISAGLSSPTLWPHAFAQQEKTDAASIAKTAWQLEQAWEESRDLDCALKVLKNLSNEYQGDLTENQQLLILQLQLRFGDASDAEKTFNAIADHAVSTSDQQFPYALTRKMGNRPDQYQMLEKFINRPTLKVDQRQRAIGNDRLKMWKVSRLLRKKEMSKAMEVANELSVSPKDLTEGRKDYRSNEYVCVTTWQYIFTTAISQGEAELALGILDKFQHTIDQTRLIRHREKKIRLLPAGAGREKLIAFLDGQSARSTSIDKTRFETLLQEKKYETAEQLLKPFLSEPRTYIARVLALLDALHADGKGEMIGPWLDKIVSSGNVYRTRENSLLKLLMLYDREEDALAYFGALRCRESKTYMEVQLKNQPLCELAILASKAEDSIWASEILNSIEEPVWRSGTLARLSQAFAENEPEQAQQYWNESLEVLKKIENAIQSDLRLKRNCQCISIEKYSVAQDISLRFQESSYAAEFLANWWVETLKRHTPSDQLLRSGIDQISEIDSRKLLSIASALREFDSFDNCLYAITKMREDNVVSNFSYVNYEFQNFFAYGIDRLTRDQLAAIFDRQLPRHRGAVMSRCLAIAKKGDKRSEVMELIFERIEMSEFNLGLHNELLKCFVDKGDLEQLGEMLERDVPDSQFLDDTPVSNQWRVVQDRHEFAPWKLTKKIGAKAMLEFARSIQRVESRQVAYTQALAQIAEDDGLVAAVEVCDEIVDRAERAFTLLNTIKKYLEPPVNR